MKKIAVLGPKGTFCDSAHMKYVKQSGNECEPVYVNTIDEIFEQVDKGICELGIAPIENTLDGYVQRTLDLLLEKDVHIIEENMVSVQFALVGNVKAVQDIETLYVQFKANGQCREFINGLTHADIITTQSNMESYYKIEGVDGAAAIVPAHIAEAEVSKPDRLVIENVTDATSNHTRFVVIEKGNAGEAMSGNGENVRISAYIMPQVDRPGILYEILRCFYDNKVNLVSIMSRPTKHEIGTYNFYVEIKGESGRLDVMLHTFNEISRENGIKILGIYSE